MGNGSLALNMDVSVDWGYYSEWWSGPVDWYGNIQMHDVVRFQGGLTTDLSYYGWSSAGPQLAGADFNGDGCEDYFLTGPDYNGTAAISDCVGYFNDTFPHALVRMVCRHSGLGRRPKGGFLPG